jgi:hypothetical protein
MLNLSTFSSWGEDGRVILKFDDSIVNLSIEEAFSIARQIAQACAEANGEVEEEQLFFEMDEEERKLAN